MVYLCYCLGYVTLSIIVNIGFMYISLYMYTMTLNARIGREKNWVGQRSPHAQPSVDVAAGHVLLLNEWGVKCVRSMGSEASSAFGRECPRLLRNL